jgi:hypothetical protein
MLVSVQSRERVKGRVERSLRKLFERRYVLARVVLRMPEVDTIQCDSSQFTPTHGAKKERLT